MDPLQSHFLHLSKTALPNSSLPLFFFFLISVSDPSCPLMPSFCMRTHSIHRLSFFSFSSLSLRLYRIHGPIYLFILHFNLIRPLALSSLLCFSFIPSFILHLIFTLSLLISLIPFLFALAHPNLKPIPPNTKYPYIPSILPKTRSWLGFSFCFVTHTPFPFTSSVSSLVFYLSLKPPSIPFV